MLRSVLACQFVSRLLQPLKVKVAGGEDTMDQLLVKPQFEEAKWHDLKKRNTPIQVRAILPLTWGGLHHFLSLPLAPDTLLSLIVSGVEAPSI